MKKNFYAFFLILLTILTVIVTLFIFASCTEEDLEQLLEQLEQINDINNTDDINDISDIKTSDMVDRVYGTDSMRTAQPFIDLTEAKKNGWEVLGPGGGGSMLAPSISPHNVNDMMVACDMGGVYVSHDAGKTWDWTTVGGRALKIYYDPVDPNKVWMCDNDLWLSKDKGDTWTNVAGGGITAVTVDLSDNSRVYASQLTSGFNGILQSKDGGETWSQLADVGGYASMGVAHYNSQYVELFIDNNLFPDKLIAYSTGYLIEIDTSTGGIKTIDTPALPEDDVSRLRAFTWGKDNNNKYYFYMLTNANTDPKLFYSHDLVGWTQTQLPGSGWIKIIETCKSNPSVIYTSYEDSKVYKSTDYGQTWSLQLDFGVKSGAGPGMPDLQDRGWMVTYENFGAWWEGGPLFFSVAPNDPDYVLFTSMGTTWKTYNGGENWYPAYTDYIDGGYATTGLDVTTGYKVVINPFEPDEIAFCYTDIGLMVSLNGGKSWRDGNKGTPSGVSNTCYDLIFDPDVPGKVWSVWSEKHDLPWRVDYLNPTVTRGAVCRSTTGLSSGSGSELELRWTNSSNGLPASPFVPYSIVVDPTSEPGNRTLYIAAPGHGVYKSINDGIDWVLETKVGDISPRNNKSLKLDINENGRLFLLIDQLGAEPAAVFYSDNGAKTWDKIDMPIDRSVEIKCDPINPDGIYLGGMPGGLWYTADLGSNWINLSDPNFGVSGFDIDPNNPDRIVICLSGYNRAYYTETRGVIWHEIKGYTSGQGVHAFFDALDYNKAYFTGGGAGFWHGPLSDKIAVNAVTPRITGISQSGTDEQSRIVQGSSVTFSIKDAIVDNSGSVSYQWYKGSLTNGTVIEGETGKNLTVKPDDSGICYYYIKAVNIDTSKELTEASAVHVFSVRVMTQSEYDAAVTKDIANSNETSGLQSGESVPKPEALDKLAQGEYSFNDPHGDVDYNGTWNVFDDLTGFGEFGVLREKDYEDLAPVIMYRNEDNGLQVIRIVVGERRLGNPSKLMLGDENPGNNMLFGPNGPNAYGGAVTYIFDYPVTSFSIGPLSTYLFASPMAILHKEPLDYLMDELPEDCKIIPITDSNATGSASFEDGYCYLTLIAPFGSAESWGDVTSIGQVDIKVTVK